LCGFRRLPRAAVSHRDGPRRPGGGVGPRLVCGPPRRTRRALRSERAADPAARDLRADEVVGLRTSPGRPQPLGCHQGRLEDESSGDPADRRIVLTPIDGAPAGRRGGTDPPPVRSVTTSAYSIPTDQPEADGTANWDSTTLVVVHVEAGDAIG